MTTTWRLQVALASLVSVLAAGCDCAGETGGDACERRDDCGAGEACIDGRCAPSGDAGGEPGTDGGGTEERDANLPPAMDAGPCRAINAESTVEPIPVDIIITIDNSGSMSEEAEEVRTNINRFAEIIAASGLDYRVVLISTPTGSTGVCVPPPLGSGTPECQSGPEGRLLAIHQAVASRNAPDLVLSRYPDYRDFLRPEAAKVFLWITDDESREYTADELRAALAALEPAGMFDRTIHNAIVGFYGDAPEGWSNEGAGTCDSLARVGTTYLRLANCLSDSGAAIADCTSGSQGRVCETDWTTIFEEMARGVVEGVPVVCEFAVPEPPEGLTLDLDAIGVTYRSGDEVRAMLERVDGMAACTGAGWYFDDPVAPTTMSLCPEVCRTVQGDPDARLDIALGCDPRLD